ncbi:hypothetical protein F511_20377 [Dorcoceras hygrometricum]|uniref:Uncharacterized protein n=1 Tax=Dorcoceras hygrometricum TaxID=472368 RepID=A0A2Z7CUZ2_9LAMI|nr:hypothetical protein F511_20377 [Dorcoceras hygrometricum]
MKEFQAQALKRFKYDQILKLEKINRIVQFPGIKETTSKSEDLQSHSIVFTVISLVESVTNWLCEAVRKHIIHYLYSAAASALCVVLLGVHLERGLMIGYKRDDKRTDDRYKKEDRYNRDDKSDERAVDRSKERSKDIRIRMRGDKRSSRKHDRKVLVAEESTKSWADTDSESSSSSSSSSDSEQDEVHCLMADQTSDDEVFDFSNVEFT